MKKGLKGATGLAERNRGSQGLAGGGQGLNGGRKGVDSRTNKTLAASFLPVWPDTDPLYARASVLRPPPTPASCAVDPHRSPVNVSPRRTGLSARYLSSSLINGTVESKDASRNNFEWD